MDKQETSGIELSSLTHCRGLLRGCVIGCLIGVVLGPAIALIGFLIGIRWFDTEIGPIPIIFGLGFFGFLGGALFGAIVGCAVDFVRERDRPSLFALIGILVFAGPLLVLVLMGALSAGGR